MPIVAIVGGEQRHPELHGGCRHQRIGHLHAVAERIALDQDAADGDGQDIRQRMLDPAEGAHESVTPVKVSASEGNRDMGARVNAPPAIALQATSSKCDLFRVYDCPGRTAHQRTAPALPDGYRPRGRVTRPAPRKRCQHDAAQASAPRPHDDLA